MGQLTDSGQLTVALTLLPWSRIRRLGHRDIEWTTSCSSDWLPRRSRAHSVPHSLHAAVMNLHITTTTHTITNPQINDFCKLESGRNTIGCWIISQQCGCCGDAHRMTCDYYSTRANRSAIIRGGDKPCQCSRRGVSRRRGAGR